MTRTPTPSTIVSASVTPSKFNWPDHNTILPSLSPPPNGCHFHPILQVITCYNNGILLVESPEYVVDYVLPVADPLLVKGNIIISEKGKVLLLLPQSFLCADGNLTMNGTLIVSHKNVSEKLVLCANTNASRLILQDGFKIKSDNPRSKCISTKINIISPPNSSLANITDKTLYIKVKREYISGCLEQKYIGVIVSVVSFLIITCIIAICLVVAIVLTYYIHIYKSKYKDAETSRDLWVESYLYAVGSKITKKKHVKHDSGTTRHFH
jgi:hypothetical protein